MQTKAVNLIFIIGLEGGTSDDISSGVVNHPMQVENPYLVTRTKKSGQY
jgi:hypothetical protein